MDQLIDSNDESMLALHLHFRGQRFRSRAVSCCCEPTFEEGFLLELHKNEAGIYLLLCSMKLSWANSCHTVYVIQLVCFTSVLPLPAACVQSVLFSIDVGSLFCHFDEVVLQIFLFLLLTVACVYTCM